MFHFYSIFAAISLASAPSNEEIIADCQFCSPELISPPEVYCKPCTYRPDRCNNIWTGFDILLWRACVDGFSCHFGNVSITNTTSPSLTTTAISQTDKDIQFDWDLGFRASFGYEFAPIEYDVGLYWTRFHQKTRTKDGVNRAHWKLDFDTVDGTVSHRVWIDPCFDLIPEFHLRYAQIEQHFNTDLLTIHTSQTAVTRITTISRNKQNFWGLGPVFGLQADWYFLCGFSLFGALDGGILYGHFKTEHNDKDSTSTVATICSSRGNSCSAQFVLDLSLGICWEDENVTLKTGLEHHRFANFNQIGCSGDLNLYGATFGIEIHY